MDVTPDYPRLVRAQCSAWAREFGPAKAREKLRVHISGWKHPRGPLFVIGHQAINEVEKQREDLTSSASKSKKLRPFGEGSQLMEGRDGFSGPEIGGA